MMRAMRASLVATALAVVATACGPIAYLNQVTSHAQSAVDAATAAGAETASPYWYTRATLLLHLAREEAARADFQGANHFGRLSEEAAVFARKVALAKAGH
jgi:predicted RNA polymerase sigma factor